MRQGSLDKKQQEKNHGKAVTRPDKTGDTEIEKAGRGSEGAKDQAPRKSRKKKQNSDTQEEMHKGAKKSLRRAVKAEVRKDRKRIARALVDRSLKGNMRGTEVLLSLMEHCNKEGEDGRKKRSGPTLAELLASEPEWEGEETEAVGEEAHAGDSAGNEDSE